MENKLKAGDKVSFVRFRNFPLDMRKKKGFGIVLAEIQPGELPSVAHRVAHPFEDFKSGKSYLIQEITDIEWTPPIVRLIPARWLR